MFIQVIFICLLSNILLTESAEHAFADVPIPKSLSLDAHIKNLDNLWTPDRLKNAKPLHIVLPLSTTDAVVNNSAVSTGPASNIEGSSPSHGSPLKRAIRSTGRQVSTTGRVFWEAGAYDYSCSAVVVSSQSNDLIVTAAHCVYDTDTKTWFNNNNNWVFIPAYSDGNKPYGTWAARRFNVGSLWITSVDYNSDVAFVALYTVNQKHVQAVVGSQGIAFNQPRLAYIYDFGYPVNLDNGQYLQSCAGYVVKSSYKSNNYDGQALACTMGPGCSGGPWLQNVVQSTGIGSVVSVNSFQIANIPNVINGPYFNSNTQSLYFDSTGM